MNYTSKKYLENLYLKKRLSMKDISLKLKCGETVIHKWLHKFNIPIRTRSQSLTGRVKSPEHLKKIAEHHKLHFLGKNNPNWKRGEKLRGYLNPNWKGGITGWQRSLRSSRAYKEWRLAVLKRDKSTCQMCGKMDVNHVDHIKPFAFFESLRFDVKNGRVLCLPCHRKTFFGTKLKNYYKKMR